MIRRSARSLSCLPLVVFATGVSALSTPAAVLTVTNLADSGPHTLREAIAIANTNGAPNNIIEFPASLEGTILLTTGELVVSNNLTILHLGVTNLDGAGKLILSAGQQSRVFRFFRGMHALAGLSLMEGNSAGAVPADGGAIFNGGDLTLSNCVFSVSQASAAGFPEGRGGAVCSTNRLTLVQCAFTLNSASALGGAVFSSGIASATRVTFAENTADGGGAWCNAGILTSRQCVFTNNSAFSGGGGAVLNASNAMAEFIGTAVLANRTYALGGGGLANLGQVALRDRCALAANSVQRESDGIMGGGGGLYNRSGRATLEDCVIGPDNLAPKGGGILNVGDRGNTPAALVVNRCGVLGNHATLFGGGVMNLSAGGVATARLTNSTLTGNWAEQVRTAGALDNSCYLSNALMSVVNCTVAFWNYVLPGTFRTAGGIYCGKFSTTGTDHSDVELRNTLIAWNYRGPTEPLPQAVRDNGGTITSLGFNLCGDATAGLTQATDLPNTAPQLAPDFLPGTYVYPLLPGSPAIDRGHASGSATDQRGQPRPADQPSIPNALGGDGGDIGAYEQERETVQIQLAGPDVWLVYPTLLDESYKVEFAPDLLAPAWTAWTNVTGTGFAITNVDAGAAALPRRFYRITGRLP